MALEVAKVQQWAQTLDRHVREGRELKRITHTVPGLTIQDGYRIQAAGIQLRLGRGEKIIGYKMGLTSQAKMKQMGVDSPISGVLTDVMRIDDGSTYSLSDPKLRPIHPKIEPEIAFITARELKGRVSADEALAACEGVCAAMEIIDSRYLNFEFQLPDVLADNTSANAFVLGRTIKKPSELGEALGNLGMVLEANGQPVLFGSSAAIYGHPAASLAALVEILSARGESLPAGSIVLAGGATAAIPLERGQTVRTAVQDLSDVSIRVE